METLAVECTECTYGSESPRLDDAAFGRLRRPRARGDQEIEPTPYIFSVGNISRSSSRYMSE